ncbi:hypothetical protein [Rhodoplanes sp. SY1]|uniref:hypothetical protein n=1 Tax=Rhodoplanes sp. SY1 TaxID=3166646 RepID=UPI0038B4AE48
MTENIHRPVQNDPKQDPKTRDKSGQQGTHEPWKEPGQRSQQTGHQGKVAPTGRRPAGGTND